jgi:hypothetical protein
MSGLRERTGGGGADGPGGAGALEGWQQNRTDMQGMFDAAEHIISQGLSSAGNKEFIRQTRQEGAQ